MKSKLIAVLPIALAAAAALAPGAPSQASAPPPPSWPGPDALIPPPEAPGVRTSPGAPSSTQTSEFMAGTVVYSVIFVESSGGTGNCSPADAQSENWSADRQAQVLSEIQDGLSFWTSRANRPYLTFILDNQGTRPTSCEPINRSGGRPKYDQNGHKVGGGDEDLWIADVLLNLGLPANTANYFSQARSLAHSRRTALGADWAFIIFVVDSLNDPDGRFSNGMFAYAYLNGPFMVMTHKNDGWDIDRMNLVAAHETGHIFGALDEYEKYADGTVACSVNDTWGYLNAANASCNNGGITSDISIMGEGSEQVNAAVDVSASARAAIGWRNPAPGAGPGAVVDVVRTATVSLPPYSPDPTTDSTPTYSATAGNPPFPPGNCNTIGGNCRRAPAPVTISKVLAAEWNVDSGGWSRGGIVPTDGQFNGETEHYTFTPPSPVSYGMRIFGTRSINNFGHISSPAYDTLLITDGGGGGGGGGGCRPPKCLIW